MADREKKRLLPAIAACLLLVAGCNMEVGNPDTGDAPASLLHSVQLRLTPYQDCSTAVSPCTSVPVGTGLPGVNLRYELAGATFSVAGIAPRPAIEQPVGTVVDLFSEPLLRLAAPAEVSTITDLELRFAPSVSGGESWQISGKVVGDISGVAVNFSLPLSRTGNITGSVQMPATGLEAVWFDAAEWFDWVGDPSISQIGRILESGVCSTAGSTPCGKINSVLSGLVERRIARSLRAKAAGKRINK